MGQIVSAAGWPAARSGRRAVRGAAVERRTHDDGAGAAEAVRVVEVGRRHAGEGGVRAVHVAEPHAGEATVPTSRSPGVARAGGGTRRPGKERPKRPKEWSKRAKEWSTAPRSGQRGPKSGQRGPKSGQRGPRSGQQGQRGAILGALIDFRRDFWRKSTVIAPRAANRPESPNICSEKDGPAAVRQAIVACTSHGELSEVLRVPTFAAKKTAPQPRQAIVACTSHAELAKVPRVPAFAMKTHATPCIKQSCPTPHAQFPRWCPGARKSAGPRCHPPILWGSRRRSARRATWPTTSA